MPQFEELVRQVVILALPILLAVTLHELAHGLVADRLGDPTPRRAGRLTLNPLAHLDVVGTLVFVLTRMIGWAKPVPVNPVFFKNPRRDMLWVGLAGPTANFALAVAMAVVYRGLEHLPGSGSTVGVQVVLPLMLMARAGVLINLGLGLFNLIPIPPLDGSKVLTGLLPASAGQVLAGVERYGFLLLILLVFSGVLDHTLFPVLGMAARVLLGA